MERRLGITWGLSSIHGWGVFGLNLVRVLTQEARPGWPRPLLLNETPLDLIDPALRSLVEPLAAEQQRLQEGSAHIEQVGLRDTVILHSSGNGLAHSPASARYRGERNVGFTFFEETAIDPAAIGAARTLDAMRTGSNWNRDHLLSLGLNDVETVHQGVDTERFQPRPKTERFDGRFVVFSGGKLEFRKGQDIALSAFKIFHQRHPDAVLVTVWQNPWAESVASLGESPLIESLPATDADPAKAIVDWTTREGLPAGAHIDLGVVGNADMPSVFSDVDVALFTNRAEGGTNLVAMECMASGIPCIVSMNTGHLDIADDTNALPLTKQRPVDDPEGCRMGWGESDVEEVVALLERAYRERDQQAISNQAVSDMRQMTWSNQIAALVRSLGYA